MKSLTRKILWCVCVLSLMSLPAHAKFSALERGSTAGRIIYAVSNNAYLAKNGQAITEANISGLSAADYGKTGLIADGNSRLILRYQSSQPGTVAFSISPSISGSRLESFTNRQEITAPLNTVSTDNGYQASAVLIAPETWPDNINYPSGNFTVTATFTPTNGSATTESLNLTLKAPSVILIHGAFGDNERMFGYVAGSNTGVWHKLESADLNVVSWNYDSKQPPKTLIATNTNGLAQIISDTLNKLNAQGFAATRVDLVTHSSGGLMARQYLRTDVDTGNNTANSYGLGTVRRVVMIASPNLGTPIGSYLSGNFSSLPSSWQNWAAKDWWEGIGHFLIKILASNSNYYSDEVMSDVSLSSSYLAGLGYPGIPFHSIYGKIKSDEDKINQLFDNVVNKDVVALRKIKWLPERLVENLTSSKLGVISGILSNLSDDIRFKELLGALFGDDDHDLIVSETSAKDNFPSNAVTSFTGLETHNHIVIARQDDVGERVLALLKGSTDNFNINTASSAEYNAAFDTAADSFSKYLNASESDYYSEYYDDSLTIEISELKDEEDNTQSIQISGKSSSIFSNDIYIVLDDGEGATKFFAVQPTNELTFSVNISAGSYDKGLYEVSYLTVQDGELKVSDSKIIAFPPQFDSNVTPDLHWTSTGNIYAYVGEEIPAGLIIEADSVKYDISSTMLGVTSYEFSDTSVAEITSLGEIKALKEGTTTITASAYGQKASVNFIVKTASSESDTTNDILASSENVNLSSSSSGGCNTFSGSLILLAVMALFTKKR